MKKILALVLAMTVISVFAVIPAFAASTMVYNLGSAEIEVGADGSAVKLDFWVDVAGADSTEVGNFEFVLDLPTGITLKSAALASDNKFQWTDSSNIGENRVGYYSTAGDADLIANPTATKLVLTFSIEDTSKAAEYEIKFVEGSSTIFDWVDEADKPTGHNNGKIVVKAAAPAVKTITPSATTKLTTDEFADGTKTDVQIGTAVGMKFEQPAGVTFTKMIWALTTDAGKRYSKAVALDLSDVTGEVALGATFINGSHANEGMGITTAVTPLTINAVNAIFTDGTNNYFTDAADAAEQK